MEDQKANVKQIFVSKFRSYATKRGDLYEIAKKMQIDFTLLSQMIDTLSVITLVIDSDHR